MRRWYDEERGMKMCEPDCVDEWLFDIWAIGCDYDGCHTEKDLKKLVDELVSMANKARECLWERRLFGDHGKPKPKTNADRIRAMSDEELADEFMRFFAEVLNTNTDGDWSFSDGFRDDLLKDLRQPVKDGEGDG